MVRGLNSSNAQELDWLGEFAKGNHYMHSLTLHNKKDYLLTINQSIDFRRRFLTLLSFKFREFSSAMALSIIGAADEGVRRLEEGGLSSLGIQGLSVSLKLKTTFNN